MISNSILERIYRLLGIRKDRYIDLSVIDLIRACSLQELQREEVLEKELLPRLGLNGEQTHQYPSELHQFCGTGLRSWQYPVQFSKYLLRLIEFPIVRYLEIGVRHGGTFVITVEYLQRFMPLNVAIGVDVHPCPSILAYSEINGIVRFEQLNSCSSDFKRMVETKGPFDLVMIDGNHFERGCKNDYYAVKEFSNIVVLHDVASDVWPGVRRVWSEIKALHPDKYIFEEFIGQYESLQRTRRKNYFGIGVAIRKTFFEKTVSISNHPYRTPKRLSDSAA